MGKIQDIFQINNETMIHINNETSRSYSGIFFDTDSLKWRSQKVTFTSF